MQAMQKQMDLMSRMMGSHDAGTSTGNAMNCEKMMGGDMSMMNDMMEQMKEHGAATKMH